MELYEVSTIDVNGNSVKETDFREAINRFTSEGRRTLRVNIDGVIIKLEPSHWDYYDRYDEDGKLVLTGGIIIEGME